MMAFPQQTVSMEDFTFDRKVRAIVCFGPATPVSGQRPAEYYQVTVDPDLQSPAGEYIRFGQTQGDEITGWQRISAMTVCEVLEELEPDPKGQTITMRVIVKE